MISYELYNLFLIKQALKSGRCLYLEEETREVHSLLMIKNKFYGILRTPTGVLEGHLLSEAILQESTLTYKNTLKAEELESFIISFRQGLEVQEEQLIFKVKSQTPLNLRPEYLFLRNHNMVVSPRGHIIWSAWVEPCLKLTQWLHSLKSHIEILNTGKISENYYSYKKAAGSLNF